MSVAHWEASALSRRLPRSSLCQDTVCAVRDRSWRGVAITRHINDLHHAQHLQSVRSDFYDFGQNEIAKLNVGNSMILGSADSTLL